MLCARVEQSKNEENGWKQTEKKSMKLYPFFQPLWPLFNNCHYVQLMSISKRAAAVALQKDNSDTRKLKNEMRPFVWCGFIFNKSNRFTSTHIIESPFYLISLLLRFGVLSYRQKRITNVPFRIAIGRRLLFTRWCFVMRPPSKFHHLIVHRLIFSTNHSCQAPNFQHFKEKEFKQSAAQKFMAK